MSEELKSGEVLLEEEFGKEVIEKILDQGRISIEKSNSDNYPSDAREMLQEITDEDVKGILRKELRFLGTNLSYVDGLNENNQVVFSSPQKKDTSLGVVKKAVVILKEDVLKNIKIWAYVDLVHLNGQEPNMNVRMVASKIDFDYPRWEFENGGDGQCTLCSGAGCWDCGFTGGY